MTIGFDLGHDLDREFSSSNMKLTISQPKVVRRSGVVIYQIVTGVTSNGVPSTHLVISDPPMILQWFIHDPSIGSVMIHVAVPWLFGLWSSSNSFLTHIPLSKLSHSYGSQMLSVWLSSTVIHCRSVVISHEPSRWSSHALWCSYYHPWSELWSIRDIFLNGNYDWLV